MKNFISKLTIRLKEKPIDILYIFAFFIFSASTFELMNRPWIGEVTNLKIAFDDMIPLILPMIIIYNIFGPLIVLCGILIFISGEDKVYKRYVLALFIGQIIGYLFFIFFQTYVPRADLNQLGNGFFEDALRYMYKIDAPYSGFPSLHVTGMTILIIATLKVNFKKYNKIWIIFLATWIALTTVLVKQHVVLDIPGGIVNAFVSFYLADKILSKFKR